MGAESHEQKPPWGPTQGYKNLKCNRRITGGGFVQTTLQRYSHGSREGGV